MTCWKNKFKNAVEPVFDDLYESVSNGTEAEIAIKKGQDPDYRAKLEVELTELRESEIWQAGAAVRKLRP